MTPKYMISILLASFIVLKQCTAVIYQYELLSHLRNINDGLFNNTAAVRSTGLENENDITANTYCKIGTFDYMNANYIMNGKYQFKLVYINNDGSSDELIWKQTSWITDAIITGFNAISIPDQSAVIGLCAEFKGLGYSNSSGCYLDGNAQESCGHNCIGAIGIWQGGIPGYANAVAVAYYLYILHEITASPTPSPTLSPTSSPTLSPSPGPTLDPTVQPTTEPTNEPTSESTNQPTSYPTYHPTYYPTVIPTVIPTTGPTNNPTSNPTNDITNLPTTTANMGTNIPNVQTVQKMDNSLFIVEVTICIILGLILILCAVAVFKCLCKKNKKDENEADEPPINIYVSSNDTPSTNVDNQDIAITELPKAPSIPNMNALTPPGLSEQDSLNIEGDDDDIELEETQSMVNEEMYVNAEGADVKGDTLGGDEYLDRL